MMNITKMRGNDGDIEMPMEAFTVLLEYCRINMRIEKKYAGEIPDEIVLKMQQLRNTYGDQVELWKWQVYAYIAAMKIKGIEGKTRNEN